MDNFLDWLEENGTVIQIISGIVLLAGIVAVVALRAKRGKSRQDSKPPVPPHPGSQAGNGSQRHGLTLVELLLVLVILAILTTVAIQSTAGILDQGRYDATQGTLQNVQNAIVGPAGQREPDGTPLITGFVADVGRLPNAVGTDPSTQLQELWANPNGIPTFTLNATSDSQVSIFSGWRGPYLQLPLGSLQLRDGWGNALSLLMADGQTPVAAGGAIQWLRSLGANGGQGGSGSGYAAYTDVVLIGAQNSILVNRYLAGASVGSVPGVTGPVGAGVSGTVYVLDGFGNQINPTGTITIKMFGPEPDPVKVLTNPVHEWTTTVTPTTANPVVTFTFPSATDTTPVTIGPRVVRAYLGTVTSYTKASPATRLTLLPGGQTKNLVMQ